MDPVERGHARDARNGPPMPTRDGAEISVSEPILRLPRSIPTPCMRPLAAALLLALLGCGSADAGTAQPSADTTLVVASDPELRAMAAEMLPQLAERSGLTLVAPVRIERRGIHLRLERFDSALHACAQGPAVRAANPGTVRMKAYCTSKGRLVETPFT